MIASFKNVFEDKNTYKKDELLVNSVRDIYDPKIKFGFSVYHVSANTFLHFIDRI